MANAAAPNSGDAATTPTLMSGLPPAAAGAPTTPDAPPVVAPEGDENATSEGDQPPAESKDNSAEGAPETYEFKAPEGQEYDEALINVYSEAAKEQNLSQEKAQAILEKVAPVLAQQQVQAEETLRTQWTESSKADKEFGGDKLAESLSVAKVAVDKLGTPEFKELVNNTVLGNHPEMIRFLVRVGKTLSEDSIVEGRKAVTKTPTGPRTLPEMADVMYPAKK